MRVYLLSVYEEHGSFEIEGFTNRDKIYDKVEAYLKARGHSEENIFYAKNRVKRDLDLLDKDSDHKGDYSINLVDRWGAPVLNIVDVES
jgi:hypothetical protein